MPKPTQEFDIGAMAFLAAKIKTEMDAQIHFGAEWGPLVGGPRSIDEAIEMRKAELAELKAKASALASSPTLRRTTTAAGGATAAAATTTAAAPVVVIDSLASSTASKHFKDALKPNLEAGLKHKAPA